MLNLDHHPPVHSVGGDSMRGAAARNKVARRMSKQARARRLVVWHRGGTRG